MKNEIYRKTVSHRAETQDTASETDHIVLTREVNRLIIWEETVVARGDMDGRLLFIKSFAPYERNEAIEAAVRIAQEAKDDAEALEKAALDGARRTVHG